ncbi:MAG: carotenoid oxygenase family protein [Actinobacteria bacterium]|nr:carotenoid oxygenase family protein [Actinomycetota bacterium]NBR66652.1 carotenoid oxygenase family protein [Actinomycetota bacterium]NBU15492.1 carotenoid oxygenase family protein [Actinomycetota bacterium]
MPSTFHTRGNYAPVADEIEVAGLPVSGSIPPSLRGRYLRNGPNPMSGDARHWFSGDGMVHEVCFADGGVTYRNRLVRTPWTVDPTLPKVSPEGDPDLTRSLANTSVLHFSGSIYALEENSLPYRLGPQLDTLGPWDMGGRLRTPMTAHPKLCPVTGELHFFGYAASMPYLTYHVADADGVLRHSAPITVSGPTMIHDMGLSGNYVVLLDLPVVMTRMTRRQPSFAWSDTYGARLGILPRGGSDADTRWFEIEPCYIFHVANCFEREGRDGPELVMDVVRFPELWRDGSSRFSPPSSMWRYVIGISSGNIQESALDDRSVEFPRIDDRLTGAPARWAYAVSTLDNPTSSIVRYDLLGGTAPVTHSLGPGHVHGEPVFVPSGLDSAEHDGWLVTLVYDATRDCSDVVVYAADALDEGPVAEVHLPRRVPYGFHGTFIAEPESAR